MVEVTGIILAGGKSSRFGSDKALAPWGTSSMSGTVMNVLLTVFPNVLVVTKKPALFSLFRGERVKVVPDYFPGSSSIGGLFSGLSESLTRINFVCACDMPFLQAPLIEAMCARVHDADALVPVWQRIPQPLCAVYSRSSLPTLAAMIGRNDLKIKSLFGKIATRFFVDSDIRRFDPDGISFMDIDTVEQYEHAKKR
jgi:molybdopterin-guanine dinucleotide biosynthesis protein A